MTVALPMFHVLCILLLLILTLIHTDDETGIYLLCPQIHCRLRPRHGQAWESQDGT